MIKETTLVQVVPTRGQKANVPRAGGSNRTNNAQRTMNVPVEQGFSITQKSKPQIMNMKACEALPDFIVNNLTPSGESVEYRVNPQALAGTRLQAQSALWQKFRVKKFRFIVGVGTATSVTGIYTAGYTENPSQQFSTAPFACQQIFDLPGAVQNPWWMKGQIDAPIADKKKWYNVDQDSSEEMMTTAGKFIIACKQAPSTTGNTVIPIFIDYDIDFTGSALQEQVPNPSNLTPFPACVWSANTGAGLADYWLPVAVSGEIPIPTIPFGSYGMVPSILVGTDAPDATPPTSAVLASYMRNVATNGVLFFLTEADLNNGSAIRSSITGTPWPAMRFNVVPLQSN
jgi:hypothetical protein